MINGKLKKTIIFLAGFSVIAGVAYSQLKTEEPVNYLTSTVRLDSIEDTVLATGIIHPSEKVEVGSQATGQIKKIHVVLNQRVKKGDLLVEIQSDNQRDALKDAEYTLANYKAQLTSKRVHFEKTELKYKRQMSLYESDATSAEEVDDSRISYEQAKADIYELETRIKQAENSLNTATTNLAYTTIRSPIDGVVVSIPVSPGQTISAMQSTPTVVQIAQVDTVTIKPEIAEADIVKVKVGMPLYFNILGNTEQIYHSTLKSIDIGPTTLSDQGKSSITASQNSGVYYYGGFDYPNKEGKFRMSMSAQVSIVVAKSENILTVPAEAIQSNRKGEKFVNVVTYKDGKAIKEEKIVEVGLSNNIKTEIKSGLKEGEEIVLTEGKANSMAGRRPPRIM